MRILVILQFSFAIILIISTLVVVQQIRYAQQRDAGYNRSQLVYHYNTGALKKTAPSPSASPEAGGPPRFIWLPRMLERP